MNQKCGLIRKENPCRWSKKTKAFIHAGWLDKDKLKFNTNYLKKISEKVPEKNETLDELTEVVHAPLFQDHPIQEKDHLCKLLENIIMDPKVNDLFGLKD